MEWPQGFDHALCRLHEKFDFVLLFSLSCIFEGCFELAPVLWVSLSDVALKMRGLLVFPVTEHVRTFEQVFAFVAELMGYHFHVSSELLVANGARQVALVDAFEPVLAIL